MALGPTSPNHNQWQWPDVTNHCRLDHSAAHSIYEERGANKRNLFLSGFNRLQLSRVSERGYESIDTKGHNSSKKRSVVIIMIFLWTSCHSRLFLSVLWCHWAPLSLLQSQNVLSPYLCYLVCHLDIDKHSTGIFEELKRFRTQYCFLSSSN